MKTKILPEEVMGSIAYARLTGRMRLALIDNNARGDIRSDNAEAGTSTKGVAT